MTTGAVSSAGPPDAPGNGGRPSPGSGTSVAAVEAASRADWPPKLEPFPEKLDHQLLARAYRYSERAHKGQKRLSGDD